MWRKYAYPWISKMADFSLFFRFLSQNISKTKQDKLKLQNNLLNDFKNSFKWTKNIFCCHFLLINICVCYVINATLSNVIKWSEYTKLEKLHAFSTCFTLCLWCPPLYIIYWITQKILFTAWTVRLLKIIYRVFRLLNFRKHKIRDKSAKCGETRFFAERKSRHWRRSCRRCFLFGGRKWNLCHFKMAFWTEIGVGCIVWRHWTINRWFGLHPSYRCLKSHTIKLKI